MREMARCPECNVSMLLGQKCSVCGKRVCGDCVVHPTLKICCSCDNSLKAHERQKLESTFSSGCTVCGAKLEQLAIDIRHERVEKIMGDNHFEFWTRNFVESVVCSQCGNNLVSACTTSLLNDAKNAELAGRYEDSARCWEALNCYERAGAIRKMDWKRRTTVRKVDMDVCRILEQVRAGDFVIPYKCPNCGGSIKVNGSTSPERLTRCEYCGEVLSIHEIEKFLAAIL
jgi:hypothetical protein